MTSRESPVPIAPEGWTFILPSTALAAVSILLSWYAAAIVFGLLAVFLLNFFRNPARSSDADDTAIVSPADGVVVQVREIPEGSIWPGLTQQVSIFMNVFDVHVNRSPMNGEIVHYRYNPGKKLAAFVEKSSIENEQNLIVLRNEGVTIAFKQIAGLLARRIVFDLKEGDRVDRSQRIGMIKFASRVDLFFPPEVKILVSLRERVRTGTSVIAHVGES